MSSIPKYIQLVRHIQNWPLYFKRKHERGVSAGYTTRGWPLLFDVPPAFYEVFREIFMEDFYRINQLAIELPEDPVVLDIGGNVGYFSFLLASKKPKAVIYAFEPMPDNAAVFKRNIALNPSLQHTIRLSETAVTGNYNGPIDLFFDGSAENSVVASVIPDFSSRNTSHCKVNALSLENILQDNRLQKIDLLKVDCEGSEYAIFYDSPDHIWEKIQIIALETHELDNDSRNTFALSRFLEGKGFIVESFIAENDCFYLKACRNR